MSPAAAAARATPRAVDPGHDVTGWPDWIGGTAADHLRQALRSSDLAHAYLISGTKGVGKHALALAFCQAICCTNLDRDDPSLPCGICRECRNVAHRVHPDVEWFGLAEQQMLSDKGTASSNLSIETIRRLRGSALMLPLEASRRVLVVDDAESMLPPAQQALLKTLEEPPPSVILLLLAAEAESLLETVRSRCQRLVIPTVPEARIASELQALGAEHDVAEEIAELSRGRIAWALEAFQAPALLDASRKDRETAKTWMRQPRYEQLVTAYHLGERFTKHRDEVIATVQMAVQLLRGELLSATGQSADTKPGDAPQTLTARELARAIAATLRCLGDLEANARPRLTLETMVMSWPDMSHG
jgi:DNA polymerase-3 subunit delta'